jgi:hypothetical protein
LIPYEPSAKVVSDLECHLCKEPLRKGSRYCKACSTDQRVPWLKSVVALISLGPLLTGMVALYNYAADYHSQTHLKVTSADGQHIFLKAWNSGGQPSTLVGYRLIFDDGATGKEVMLDLMQQDKRNGPNVITTGNPVLIRLVAVLPANVPAPRTAAQYTVEERTAILGSKSSLSELPVTLEIDVQESNDPGHSIWDGRRLPASIRWLITAPIHTRRDRFTADRIAEFIQETVKP